MTKIKDLIATLETRSPDAQVFMMTTRKQPYENYLAGVVGREDMFDQKFRSEPGIAADDVFLVVGRRIRPGSLSAWIVSEHHDTIVHPVVDLSSIEVDELAGTTLQEIAREYLGVGLLGDAVSESTEFHCLGSDLRRALEAAYLAGCRSRDRASDAEAAQPVVASDTLPARLE
jgi:hypothetical protein